MRAKISQKNAQSPGISSRGGLLRISSLVWKFRGSCTRRQSPTTLPVVRNPCLASPSVIGFILRARNRCRRSSLRRKERGIARAGVWRGRGEEGGVLQSVRINCIATRSLVNECVARTPCNLCDCSWSLNSRWSSTTRYSRTFFKNQLRSTSF